MKHFASPDFWFHYRLLPENIQDLADKNFSLLKENSRHPSLRLKKWEYFGRQELESATGHWEKKEKRASSGFGLELMPNTTSS